MKTDHMIALSVLIGISILVGGCATSPKRPIVIAQDFNALRIGEVDMLPVFDARKDTSTSLDMQRNIGAPILSSALKKGYKVTLLQNVAFEGFSSSDMIEMTPEELCALGPVDAKNLLIVIVEDVSSKYAVMGYTYKVEVVGILLDKANKKVLWKDKGIGNAGQGGLISGLVAPLIKSEALSGAINSLMRSLPSQQPTAGR